VAEEGTARAHREVPRAGLSGNGPTKEAHKALAALMEMGIDKLVDDMFPPDANVRSPPMPAYRNTLLPASANPPTPPHMHWS
jgi:hypothetical protein